MSGLCPKGKGGKGTLKGLLISGIPLKATLKI